ncbi:hypothetical protein GGTG_06381 [Gaeumannomyces tritici R3-111a-1]|uniref:Uncharacterized protein n=1 Tax=Gaeumannomyces tritici (strain R3-111a-1) TaxID=644352 RepID=J3NYM9_GAET3|nr:hypothetical protein GGTG_06381 [Gaeumannomyces tritici R3-111a-1]EJT76462.1 hypothetical protein GGTG_06381 [Gaeumannomyces tritici R3-111a-1]
MGIAREPQQRVVANSRIEPHQQRASASAPCWTSRGKASSALHLFVVSLKNVAPATKDGPATASVDGSGSSRVRLVLSIQPLFPNPRPWQETAAFGKRAPLTPVPSRQPEGPLERRDGHMEGFERVRFGSAAELGDPAS